MQGVVHNITVVTYFTATYSIYCWWYQSTRVHMLTCRFWFPCTHV
jgi:hypothetical protein